MIRVGFTGTREGMTPQQKDALRGLLADTILVHGYVEFHHGDCVGADADAHDIVAAFPCRSIIVHPPTDPTHRAWKKGDVELPPKTHFARNRDIVDALREPVDMLVGCPRLNHEEPKGGTWYTIRYGRKQQKRLLTIWPSGVIEIAFPEP